MEESLINNFFVLKAVEKFVLISPTRSRVIAVLI
jgi:hypothetical protein